MKWLCIGVIGLDSQFLESDSVAELTREYVYSLQSVHQLTATVWQIKQIRSQVQL